MTSRCLWSTPPRTRSPIRRRCLGPLAVALIAACSPAPDLDAARATLLEADRRYLETANAGDVDGLAGLYADDATRYPPTGAPSSGPDAMRAFAEGVASTAGFRLTSLASTHELSPDGRMGYTLHDLDLSVTGPEGDAQVQRLRDLHTWRLEDGEWKIVVDLWQVLPDAGSP